jgi:hypothetical protein
LRFLISPCFLTISHCLATWLSQAGTATPYWGIGTSFFPWNYIISSRWFPFQNLIWPHHFWWPLITRP